MRSKSPDFLQLVPDLGNWSDFERMTPADWVGGVGSIEHAIGYTFVFWPEFVAVGPYVLRASRFDAESLRGWEEATHGNIQAIEAVINHEHLVDLHSNDEPTETQIRYLGNVVREMWEAKLLREFPDRSFEVVFNDEPGLDLLDYEVTFWQSG